MFLPKYPVKHLPELLRSVRHLSGRIEIQKPGGDILLDPGLQRIAGFLEKKPHQADRAGEDEEVGSELGDCEGYRGIFLGGNWPPLFLGVAAVS